MEAIGVIVMIGCALLWPIPTAVVLLAWFVLVSLTE